MIGNILAKTGEARFQEAPPQVLRFIGEGRVRNKEIPGKLFKGPSVSFSELVLCERNRLEVTRFGGAITSVRQSGAEGSLTVQRIRSVSDKGSGRGVCAVYLIRWRYYFMGRSREE